MRSHWALKREITAIQNHVAGKDKCTPMSVCNLAGAVTALRWVLGDFGNPSPLEKMKKADEDFKKAKEAQCTTPK
jgi:hypothetical protein